MAVQVWRYVCCELWHWLKAVGAYPWAKRDLPLGKEGKEGKAITISPAMLH